VTGSWRLSCSSREYSRIWWDCNVLYATNHVLSYDHSQDTFHLHVTLQATLHTCDSANINYASHRMTSDDIYATAIHATSTITNTWCVQCRNTGLLSSDTFSTLIINTIDSVMQFTAADTNCLISLQISYQ